ncbi:UboA [Staphylococcus phage 676Z]|uniref:UboA n=1 Tax=Staphylococcus phage 676Z TaxID=1195081 RepID=I6X4M9_9CAUD|nr:UboA [Staphylococcus phage 676Z]AFN38247.1 UboA [Staphylococcus phage 676Z]
MENYKNFIIEEMNKAHILVAKAEQIKRNRKLAETELEEVYRKAESFDEIVNELLYQLQNLESWDTLDQKDCQTLKQILEENIKEEKQLKRYKVKRTITTEEVRYIDAETEEDAWYSVEYEDEGADTAHYNAEYGTWSYEEEEK